MDFGRLHRHFLILACAGVSTGVDGEIQSHASVSSRSCLWRGLHLPAIVVGTGASPVCCCSCPLRTTDA
ncbi:hypothetical protein PF008_g24979 [Phytophthora fragariae]|uniref:Secreted protein n=1 Tax=Phytophthora fragariae TaxID=53985 RepID=A0A6G0QM86_9STRA|nr:hypothetical protein PF008_g24979 [Phytophthora fragariae]